jgi:hypothetical protein
VRVLVFTVVLKAQLLPQLTPGALRVANLDSANPPLSVLLMKLQDPVIGVLVHVEEMSITVV